MQPVRTLVTVLHGSHLYGTSTPQSDTDYKSVHIPSGDGILLQRAENVPELGFKSKNEGTDKNAPDAIDHQSFSVQKFYEMPAKGDTVATEILFANDSAIVYEDPLWGEVQATGKLLLNRQAEGFVGYCVRQAAKYGIKGSRMAAVRSVLDELAKYLGHDQFKDSRLSAIQRELHEWSTGREHVEWENIPGPNGTDLWHLNVCDRKMPMTVNINEAYKVWEKVWENYGERARQAMTNEGIDWKAMSHAVRVAGQAIELMNTGQIIFPRPNADHLRAIKRGQLPYKWVGEELEQLVAEVHKASERSTLPEKSDPKLVEPLLRRLHLGQVR